MILSYGYGRIYSSTFAGLRSSCRTKCKTRKPSQPQLANVTCWSVPMEFAATFYTSWEVRTMIYVVMFVNIFMSSSLLKNSLHYYLGDYWYRSVFHIRTIGLINCYWYILFFYFLREGINNHICNLLTVSFQLFCFWFLGFFFGHYEIVISKLLCFSSL